MKRKPPKNGFKKGHAKIGGRQKGTPNRFTGQLKDLGLDNLEHKGEHLVRAYERLQDQLAAVQRRIARNRARGKGTKLLRAEAEQLENKIFEYEEYSTGGARAGMAYFANQEPNAYMMLLQKLLPMQIEGKVNGNINHRYETVEDVEKAMRARGLPIPPRMIDVTPIRDKQAA